MELTRRHALAGAAALTAAPLLHAAPAKAAAPLAGKQNASFYRYKVGDAEVTVVSDGASTFPLGDSFVLNVKKDEVLRYITFTGFGAVPELARREINTAVLIEDGQTVVIGGVYEFSDRASVAKVPFLGDIPFLGNLFKKKGRSKEKAELLIFVTPKVLRVAERR